MAEPQRIVILGTAGNCIDILETIRDLAAARGAGSIECVGFLDDDRASWGKEVEGVPVLGGITHAAALKGVQFVNGIGSPTSYHLKAAILARTGVPGERFATLAHPSAVVARSASLGHGTVLLPHVTIGARAQIGCHVIVLPQSVVGHDAVLGDFGCVAAGVVVSGAVTIGAGVYLGAGATLIQGIKIGAGALVGLGAVVLADVAAGAIVVGNPAKIMNKSSD